MDERKIYLDNNATTPLSDEVKNAMLEAMDNFGNPSSIYKEGRIAKRALDTARQNIAQLINCSAKRIIFSSGGSEANNFNSNPTGTCMSIMDSSGLKAFCNFGAGSRFS